MNPIIEYLKNPSIISADLPKVQFTDEDISKINMLSHNNTTNVLKFPPRPEEILQNQIWTIRNEYQDFNGNILSSPYPFYVLTAGAKSSFNNEEFVNVYILSPYIEMADENDIIVYDEKFTGFPFLIEYWNSQPTWYRLLDIYLGTLTDFDKGDSNYSNENDSYSFNKFDSFFDNLNQIYQETKNINKLTKSVFFENKNNVINDTFTTLSKVKEKNVKVQNLVISMIEEDESESDIKEIPYFKSNKKYSNFIKQIKKLTNATNYWEDFSKNEMEDTLKYVKFTNEFESNINSYTSYSFVYEELWNLFSNQKKNLNNLIEKYNLVFSNEFDFNSIQNIIKKRKNISINNHDYNKPDEVISEFRSIEIQNATYISNSFTSYLK